MNKATEILPGHTISHAQYEIVEAAVTEFAPDLPRLTWERFVDPMGWSMIPDDQEDGYRAEFVLLRTRERTLRVHDWYLPDLRGGTSPRPHNHPWPFASHILTGEYIEDRWTRTPGGIVTDHGVNHVAGDVNDVDLKTYHEVTAVEPGTLSLMVCGLGVRNGWGYLDMTTGDHIPYVPDPEFDARFARLNPHLRTQSSTGPCVPTKKHRRSGERRSSRAITRP